jgi:hypothetical protein
MKKIKKYCTFGHKMHLYSVGLSRCTISLVRVPPEQQARDKNKAKGRIYDRFLKVHGDKEDADIIKKPKLIGAYPVPHLTQLSSLIDSKK